MSRPHKLIKLKYSPEFLGYVYVGASEARIGAGNKAYVSCTESGVTIGGGFPSNITFNTLAPCWGGLVTDIPWPLSMIPMFVPTQIPKIPFLKLLPVLPKVLAALPI